MFVYPQVTKKFSYVFYKSFIFPAFMFRHMIHLKLIVVYSWHSSQDLSFSIWVLGCTNTTYWKYFSVPHWNVPMILLSGIQWIHKSSSTFGLSNLLHWCFYWFLHQLSHCSDYYGFTISLIVRVYTSSNI